MNVRRLSVIALTGGIGSGKSTAAAFLSRLDPVQYINADQVSRDLLVPEEKGWQALKKMFGPRYFNDDGTVNRRLLRTSIFQDETLRNRVNGLLHPLIRQNIWEMVHSREWGEQKVLFVVEVPLLYEVGWQKDFDAVIVVYAHPEICIERLMQRDGVSRAEAEAVMSCQLSLDKKTKLADYIVDNSGPLVEVEQKLTVLGEQLIAEFMGKKT